MENILNCYCLDSMNADADEDEDEDEEIIDSFHRITRARISHPSASKEQKKDESKNQLKLINA